MSHVATVEVIVKDLEALKRAASECGLEFREQQSFRWFGQWMNDYDAKDAAYKYGISPQDYGKCSYALGIPNSKTAYEIGVVKRKDGKGYNLLYDFYCGGFGLMDRVATEENPTGIGKLTQAYSVQVAMAAAKKQGYRVTVKTTQDGKKVLQCRK